MPDAWRSQLEDLLDAELREGPLDDPFPPAVLRWATATGRPADREAVLATLERVAPGGRGAGHFRWRTPVGRWIAPERLVRWRPAEAELAQRHPNDHAARLWVPPILGEHLALLEELRQVRQRQGVHLGVVKAANSVPPDEGVMVRLGS